MSIPQIGLDKYPHPSFDSLNTKLIIANFFAFTTKFEDNLEFIRFPFKFAKFNTSLISVINDLQFLKKGKI